MREWVRRTAWDTTGIEQACHAEENFLAGKWFFHEIVSRDAGAEKLFHCLLIAAHHDDRDVAGIYVAADGAQGAEIAQTGREACRERVHTSGDAVS